MLDVPDVEFDPLSPGKRGSSVDLSPAGDAGLDVEAPPLVRRVLVDLVPERRPRPDQAHVAAHDIPELRQFVK